MTTHRPLGRSPLGILSYQRKTNLGGTQINLSKSTIDQFQHTIYAHFNQHQRQFTWRRTLDPFFILVSEMMLQQTQVARVTRFYDRFISQFPTIRMLAQAPLHEVLQHWSGLGYNRRALALHKTAQIIVNDYDGRLPSDNTLLQQLPGIGPATAGAILAFAYRQPVVFIETNIRRVYIHQFFSGKRLVSDSSILPLVRQTLDSRRPRRWYYALMDYGAALGITGNNPNRRSAHYTKQRQFSGSNRQLRGIVIRILTIHKSLSYDRLVQLCENELTHDEQGLDIKTVVDALAKEQFMTRNGNFVSIASKN